MPFTYDYPRPAVTVDCVVFGLDEVDLKVLLIERKHPPFAGAWALPGGFVEMDEDLETAARRELQEETGLKVAYLEQLYTFGDVDRDPRGRVISVAYIALVKREEHLAQGADDAERAAWFPAARLPALAFDHGRVIAAAGGRLSGKVRYQPIGFDLLPKKFTLRQLQHLYETLLGRPLDRRNFRKKMLGMELLVELDEVEQGVPRRPARLYRFDRRRYQRLAKEGFVFEI